MARVIVNEQDSETVTKSPFQRATVIRHANDESRRFSRLLAASIVVGGAFVILVSKFADLFSATLTLTQEKEDFMSKSAPAPQDNANGNSVEPRPKNPLLETLLDQDRTVTSTTDNLVDQARTDSVGEFSRTFEQRVGALSGFGASLRHSQK